MLQIFGSRGKAYLTGSLPTAMSKNLYDAKWTVKAKSNDLYPLLFVMVLGVVWGLGGDHYVLSMCFFIKLRFLHCSFRHAAQRADFAKLTQLT